MVPVFRNRGKNSTLQGSFVRIQDRDALPVTGSDLVVHQRIMVLSAFRSMGRKYELWIFPCHIRGIRG